MMKTIENIASWVLHGFMGVMGAYWVFYALDRIYEDAYCGYGYNAIEVLSAAWVIVTGVMFAVDFGVRVYNVIRWRILTKRSEVGV